MNRIHEIAANARKAFFALSGVSDNTRNLALMKIADALQKNSEKIFQENQKDIAAAEKNHLSAPLLKRLFFDTEKLNQVIDGLQSLTQISDPLGRTTLATRISENLTLYRVTCPIGVIGVVFESRPDALIQIASLALKSGNAVVLKGGSEALQTNRVLTMTIREALEESGLPYDLVQMLESREDVSEMLREDRLIDLIIPRGSNAFVQYIMEHSNIPVLGHAEGLCHVYIDRDADHDTALRVAMDSKIQNVSVCNAMETLLIHKDAAPDILPGLANGYREHNVSLTGDPETVSLIGCEPATDKDWETEYLDRRLSIRIVSSLDEAIEHINKYGSHHTDCIVTRNHERASRFMEKVDSAGVYLNVSTRFADGYVYGFGAEVGIATGKIHARGPMGLEGLVTYKYKLIGNGQTMSDVKQGRITYIHQRVDEDCPL